MPALHEPLRLRHKLASLALDATLLNLHSALYLKFNPAQPRDDHGRWTSGGIGVAPDGTPIDPAATTNPNFAARMLEYDRTTFGAMIHAFKSFHGIPPNGVLVWHQDGSVYYMDEYIDNMHHWAP